MQKLILVIVLSIISLLLPGKELVKLENVTLVDSSANDGDSFLVSVNNKKLHVRLYFVDTLETSAYSKGMARRVRDQKRYFGLESKEQCLFFGHQATLFTKKQLQKPFTIYTNYSDALGNSSLCRIYCFVVTSKGEDLAYLLIKNGLARNYGFKRKNYKNVSSKEIYSQLNDLEAVAMLNRIGCWSKSMPALLTANRAKQRKEDNELNQFRSNTKTKQKETFTVNINNATAKELQKIRGIGKVMSQRIIQGRPYKTINDIKKVKGIGDKTFFKIRNFIKVSDTKN